MQMPQIALKLQASKDNRSHMFKFLKIQSDYQYLICLIMYLITKQDIEKAHQRIKPYIHRTPILSSASIASIAKVKNFQLKCQNLQKAGIFKVRGVTNKLVQLKTNPKIKSVCAHSSGSHALTMAYVSSVLKMKTFIVVPQNAPKVKKDAVKQYGATLIEVGNKPEDRQIRCEEIAKEQNATMVHPYDDYDIITGQASCAKQIFEEKPDFYDYIVAPIGGGGLLSGTLLSAKYFGNKNCKIVGVQPQLAGDGKLSIQTKKLQPNMPPITIADGLKTSLGERPFQIMSDFLTADDIILVSEQQIIEATKLVMQRMKVVIEPSSATVVAAVLKDERFRDKNVCCIISGGNFQMDSLFSSLRQKAKL